MAMFGYLFLKNGLLNGEQIVSGNWVEESTARHIFMYGYHWWVLPNSISDIYPEAGGIFYALGYGGQTIMIVPNINMVIVATSENFEDRSGAAVSNMLFDYILPALKEK
jgi:CubicO group peptidase (beta-lactamase class C family)